MPPGYLKVCGKSELVASSLRAGPDGSGRTGAPDRPGATRPTLISPHDGVDVFNTPILGVWSVVRASFLAVVVAKFENGGEGPLACSSLASAAPYATSYLHQIFRRISHSI